MLRILCIVGLVSMFSSISIAASGAMLRYALVVGNNVGVDGNGNHPFPPLKFAEKEALVLKDKLVSLSNFDNSRDRTKLLLGATKAELKAAIAAVAAQKENDRSLLGKTESLFLFYFTGHGLEGRLLLDDGPITAAELGELLRSVNADFTIGVFDACYSGSLQKEALKSKGLKPTPGLNLFTSLPEQVLSAEGSVWYVSSGPGQASYEDERLGGLFTHFFTEALEAAPLEGPGITLERVWNYARQHTVEYAAARQREQSPEQFIAKFKASAPIYFSFPVKRSASLVLSESISGRFTLSYADGYLTEIVQKSPGKVQKLAVYPGRARLSLISNGGSGRTIQEFVLSENEEIVLHRLQSEMPSSSVGSRSVILWEKGMGQDRPIVASSIRRGLSILGGPAYTFQLSPEKLLLPEHIAALRFRFDIAKFALSLLAGYGVERERFTAWNYVAQAFSAMLTAGVGFDFPRPVSRLTLSAAFFISYIHQRYGDGTPRVCVSLNPAAEMSFTLPSNKKLAAELFFYLGPTRSPGSGVEDNYRWKLTGGVGLTGYFRIR